MYNLYSAEGERSRNIEMDNYCYVWRWSSHHLLYVFGLMPSWFVAMPVLAALGGVFMDALAVVIFYDYNRRLSE